MTEQTRANELPQINRFSVLEEAWMLGRPQSTTSYWQTQSYSLVKEDYDKLYGFEDQPGFYKPGSLITCAEALGSPSSIVWNRDSGPSTTRQVKIVGTYNPELARLALSGWLNKNKFIEYGDRGCPLKSTSFQADPTGAEAFDVSLEFATATPDSWIDEVSITTTGGSAHITSSYETRACEPCLVDVGILPTFHKIGIDDRGMPEGVEVKRPTCQINITLNYAFGAVNPAFMNTLLNTTACMNYYPFLGFEPGSLLFEGANIDRVQSADTYDGTIKYHWRVQYVFSAMPGMTKNEIVLNSQTGEVTGATNMYYKAGWDYLWKKYMNCNVNGEVKSLLQQVNVERVYELADFRVLGIPNDIFGLGEDIGYNGQTSYR